MIYFVTGVFFDRILGTTLRARPVEYKVEPLPLFKYRDEVPNPNPNPNPNPLQYKCIETKCRTLTLNPNP